MSEGDKVRGWNSTLKSSLAAHRRWKRRSRGSLNRRTPLKPVGRRGQRERENVDGPQAELCRRSPCFACGAAPPSDPHHEPPRSRGGQDADTVPLCRTCHRQRHDLGSAERFEEVTGVDLEAEARRIGEGMS